jgi:transcriptional regulator
MADLDLLQGTLDILVLKTLSWGPRHGYAVARWIKETSDDTILVEDRALYVSLHRLEERGWVESQWGLSENNRKAKYYELTAQVAGGSRPKRASSPLRARDVQNPRVGLTNVRRLPGIRPLLRLRRQPIPSIARSTTRWPSISKAA